MVVLLLILVGLIVSFALAGYGFGALGQAGPRRSGREVRMRSLAALLGAAAAAVYTWGLLNVGLAILDAEDGGTGSAPVRPCRTPDRDARGTGAVDYTVEYLPLRFVCETGDGGRYTAGTVPGYVNPAALGLALAAIAGAGAAARVANHPAGRAA